MKKRTGLFMIILVVLILLLIIINVMSGSTKMSFGEAVSILFDPGNAGVNGTIIWDIRIPRIVAALMLGGALALAGYLLQAFFANPIAGPFVLGISSGARLMVAILMVAASQYGFGLSSVAMIAASFLGAILATGFVILAAGRVRNMAVLIVCGVMTGYIGSAVTELIVSFADDSNIVNLHNWSMGTFSSVSWNQVQTFVPVVLIGLIAAVLLSKTIEAYLYGEQYAFSVGVNVRVFRVILIVVSSLLSATVTAFAGPVSFVGIAVPHLIRKLFRTNDPRILIPASFLGGGVFCLFSDLLARSLFSPMELSISTITAIFGAPVVIWMLLGRKRTEG